jgi:hypothetical protein
MSDESKTTIELSVSAETVERIRFLAEQLGMSEREAAEKLLADQAEAEAGLTRGPWLRKYMYR